MKGTKRRAHQFSFTTCQYDSTSCEATLSYVIDGQELHEIIGFPGAPWPLDDLRKNAFNQALELLHLICGVSYYKAGLAQVIDSDRARIDTTTADFLNELYVRGLGEFAYLNNLDISSLCRFVTNIDDTSTALNLDLPERALVAMGGGKDSLVCLQMLTDAGVEVQPACVGGSDLIAETVNAAGLPLVRMNRQLSPLLAEMNAQGAWNGHVPVTAINSAVLVCAGLLYGFRYIVFANELSANEATLKDSRGREVNHQYSKSLAFETAFREVIRHRVSPDLEYFSLLRPFGELAITKRFTAMTQFHRVFSSCNRNFHLDGPRTETRWCKDCPKCRFAALALAPFMSPRQLELIQGADLLDEDEQLQGFKALCGLDEDKPFECVGSIAESRAAMKFLATRAEWKNRKIIKALADKPEVSQAGALALQPDAVAEHCIPPAILARIDAF